MEASIIRLRLIPGTAVVDPLDSSAEPCDNRVRPRVRVVAGLFRRGTAVLVQRRRQGKARAGLWELPGGKVEPGESDFAALARECREELAVEIEVGQRSWSTSHDYDDLTVDLVVYHAHMAADASPRAQDAAELRWVEPRDLRDLRFCPADVPLVEELSRSHTSAPDGVPPQ